MARSPLIVDGDLQLNSAGDLQVDEDIVTQMTVTVGAYNCIYNTSINSKVVPYVNGIPKNGFNRVTLTNYVANAHKILIIPKLISDLKIAISGPVQNYVKINISAVDIQGNQVKFSWMNPN